MADAKYRSYFDDYLTDAEYKRLRNEDIRAAFTPVAGVGQMQQGEATTQTLQQQGSVPRSEQQQGTGNRYNPLARTYE
jgi:hypothetical protein